MIIFRAVVILTLFSTLLALSGCVGGNKNVNSAAVIPDSTQDKGNSARTDIEELGLLVNVPFEAEDIVWQETADRKQLIAVLRFSSADADKIVAEARKSQTPQNVNISLETWFPAELIAQGDMSGDDSLNGLAYSADIFFQEPYTAGRIIRIEATDYFVLELSAK